MITNGQVQNADLDNDAVNSDKIANGQVQTLDLADDAVNTNKIANGEVQNADLANDAVNSSKILDGTIVNVDISNTADIAPSKIAGTAWTSNNDGAGSGLDADLLDGQHASAFLSTSNDYGRSGVATDLYEGTSTLTSKYVDEGQANSITTGMITDGEVANADLASNAVTTDKIANSTILFADIAANSAESSQVMKYDGSNWVADDDEKSETGIFPAPAYNSGWFSLTPNSSVTLNHNLGKSPYDYFVDLMYQDTDAYGINTRWFGGRDHWTGSGTSYGGAYYCELDSNSIKVTRFSNDTAADSLRVRIWIVASE
jgi:hypothetical protein